MEKGNTAGLKIAVTGPESTGKSLMAKHLAAKFGGIFVPEYAREYIQAIHRPYSYNDIETIARRQVQQYNEQKNENIPVFFDTWLIITKVWFDWVYQRVPGWLEENIRSCPVDLFLLMQPDIPWEADPARENGGENRLKLYHRYKQELENYGFGYAEIGGTGPQRYRNAENEIICILK
ncbi:MAG: ATP-binding protein [Prolixibacteraceae bacterium]|jgi:NadR type nicotinamide-nucleotide adenylyltransferase|nr:ATP-binding protein [Prolixibacteraceae bacterium]